MFTPEEYPDMHTISTLMATLQDAYDKLGDVPVTFILEQYDGGMDCTAINHLAGVEIIDKDGNAQTILAMSDRKILHAFGERNYTHGETDTNGTDTDATYPDGERNSRSPDEVPD